MQVNSWITSPENDGVVEAMIWQEYKDSRPKVEFLLDRPAALPSLLWVNAAAHALDVCIYLHCAKWIGGEWRTAGEELIKFGSGGTPPFIIAVSSCFTFIPVPMPDSYPIATIPCALASSIMPYAIAEIDVNNPDEESRPVDLDLETPSDFDSEASDSDSTEIPLGADDLPQVTLQQFLQDDLFIVLSADGERIADVRPEAYAPELKIDFSLTNGDTYSAFPSLHWKKTYDVDAVIASFRLQNVATGVHGRFTIREHVRVAEGKELKSIRRHFTTPVTAAYKIGEVGWTLSAADSIYIVTDVQTPADHVNILNGAISSALNLPCRLIDGNNCSCGAMSAFHVSNRQALRIRKQLGNGVEKIAPAIVPCFFKSLDSSLSTVFPGSSCRLLIRSIGCKAATASESMKCPTFIEDLLDPCLAEKVLVDICVQKTPLTRGREALWAFPRQGTLERLFHNSGSFYPQAFLGTYGNFHGNKHHGIFKRINVYSTAHSLLCSRTERGPFQYRGWVNRITEAFRSHYRLPEEIGQISEEITRETETSISVIRASAPRPAAIRQEFTVSIEDFCKATYLADYESALLTRTSLVLPGRIATKLYQYYVVLLGKVLKATLSSLLSLAGRSSSSGLVCKIATFGIFESLISGFLWTGNRVSISSKFTFGRNGMALDAFCRQRGVAVFDGSFFDAESMCLRDLERLEEVITKIKSGPGLLLTLRALERLEAIHDPRLKGAHVIETYCQDICRLWDIECPEGEDQISILKYPNIAEEVGCAVVDARRSWEDMITAIFDPSNLRYPQWQHPYLVLSEAFSRSHRDWRSILFEVAENIGINHLHQYGQNGRFSVGHRTFIARSVISLPSATSNISVDSNIDGRRTRRRWTDFETRSLVDCVNRYGHGNWQFILDHSDGALARFTNVQIKDRFRTLEKKGEVDRHDGLWRLNSICPGQLARHEPQTRSWAAQHRTPSQPLLASLPRIRPQPVPSGYEVSSSDDELPTFPFLQNARTVSSTVDLAPVMLDHNDISAPNEDEMHTNRVHGGRRTPLNLSEESSPLTLERFSQIVGERRANSLLNRIRSLSQSNPGEVLLWSEALSNLSSVNRPRPEESGIIFDALCNEGYFERVPPEGNRRNYKISGAFTRILE